MKEAFDAVDKLSERILKREVVFFIGSGFSLDSEGASAERLIRRLTIRFYAMAKILQRQSEVKQWKEMFSLLDDKWQPIDLSTRCPIAWKKVTQQLAREYYAANDWFCGAFDRLLLELNGAKKSRIKKLQDIYAEERELLDAFRDSPSADPAPLPKIKKFLIAWAKDSRENRLNIAGKALFLDTLGFAGPDVMNGVSYCQKKRYRPGVGPELYARHHVLARLAREGFCPNIITTNYDLLLESAWQDVGFNFENSKSGVEEQEGIKVSAYDLANRMMGLPTMMRIAGPYDFQTYGKGVDVSLILKVHGCVDQYRKCRREAIEEFGLKGSESTEPRAKRDAFQRYMKSVVFTYREIQNWRSDSWSRDYLANLQRTRVVAFAGYSLQDPVIHDSLRGVYEELADHNEDFNGESGQVKPGKAPAYFFGSGESFHANEMLAAATHAVGAKPETGKRHENYIEFEYLDKTKCNANFPNLDDLFLWKYHLTMRKFQQKCVQEHLGAILPSLIGRPGFPTEIDYVNEQVEQLIGQEKAAVNANFDRIDLKRIVGWTYWFHSRLLREFVWGEAINRHNGPRIDLTKLRSTQWYMPFSHRPSWTAWALVLELALRRILPVNDCYPVDGRVPTIYFKRQGLWETLRLELGSYQRSGFIDDQWYAAGVETTWVLTALGVDTETWKKKTENEKSWNEKADSRLRPFGRISYQCPSSKDLWRVAASDEGPIEKLKDKLPRAELDIVHD